MSENEGQAKAPAGAGGEPEAELSPSEKIEGEPPPGNVKPGVENPESEIRAELNPNTE